MSTEQHRSFDGFIDGLEKRARAARTISIVITIGTIAVAAATLFFTIREIRKRINEEQRTLESVRQDRIKAQNELGEVRKELESERERIDVYRTAVGQLPEKERDALLKKAAQISQADSPLPMVYLQILDNNQRDQANNVAKMLKRNGFKVQGVEWVREPVNLKQTQVKYFRPEFADEAQKITTLLRQSGVQASPVGFKASTGQIEIWFSADAFRNTTAEQPTKYDYGSLIGTVIDADTKAPIEGVKILLNSVQSKSTFAAVTGSKGEFRLAKLPASPVGMYQATATHTDYEGARRFINVVADKAIEIQGWSLQKKRPSNSATGQKRLKD